MNTLARKLIATDFFLHRWLIVGSTVAGLVGLVVAAEGKVRFNVGMLMWLTTLVAIMPNLPDGLMPFAVLLSGFFLANYSVVLSTALHTASEGVMTLVIIVTNMGITLFIFMIGALPSLNDHLQEPVAVWNSTFWIVLGAEFATLLVTLSLPYLIAARRRDFI
jgi:hypothetical protein